MLKCPYCNEENYESNTICWKCGANLNAPDPVAKALTNNKPVLSLSEEYSVLLAGRSFREVLLNMNLVGILRIIAGCLQLLCTLLLWGTFETLTYVSDSASGLFIIPVLLGLTGAVNIIIGILKINPAKDYGKELSEFVVAAGHVGFRTFFDYFWNVALIITIIAMVGVNLIFLASALLMLMAILTDIYKVRIFAKAGQREILWYLEHKNAEY